MKNTIDFVRAGAIYNVPENYFLINGVYLAGKLKHDENEEICASSINLLLEEEGMYDATFNGQEGFVLYLWKVVKDNDITINRGLLTSIEDLDACKEARTHFNNKSFII